LFNNDATATPDLLDLLVETMDRHPKAAAAAPTVIWPDNRVWYGGGDYLPHQGRVWHQNADADYAQMMKAETGERKVSFVTGCCLLLRVADLSRIGLLDDTFFMYWEDADWCVRAQRSGYELYYEPRATVIHATSSSYGVNSPRYLYYTFRNNLLFIKRYTPWYWKPLAWGVEKLQVWKELIKLFTRYRRDYGTYLRDIWLALYHHLRGRYGEL
jgi:GT2 family glycosyltransferase